jgi:hydroxylamine reductase (hybrid-cluster protein)
VRSNNLSPSILLPQLLTLGCGKFRLLDQEFGTLADTGLPRLLDMGQCNDAYSALVVATVRRPFTQPSCLVILCVISHVDTPTPHHTTPPQELSKAFNCSINDLPLSLDLSWFEQKAVAVLLTLLHLGVTNIRLGPALPAFLTQESLGVLVDKFKLKPADVSNPEMDLAKMMARA